MRDNLGYNKPLYILAFDHRSSFIKLIGIEGIDLDHEEIQKIKELKQIIYDGFKKAMHEGFPKETAAILVDEQFGDQILKDAKESGYTFMLPVEKSGQEEFSFEYEYKFAEHIEKYNPTFVKVLVRFNPGAHQERNKRQLANLRIINDYSRKKGYSFLAEVLIPPTESQMISLNNDKEKYDRQLRPKLAIDMIRQFQENNIEPDVWKLEGFEDKQNYENIVVQVKSGGRNNIGIVILGRGESLEKIEKWIKAGASVDGVIGFAIGRTIFINALGSYLQGKTNREEASCAIAQNYRYFYNIFIKEL